MHTYVIFLILNHTKVKQSIIERLVQDLLKSHVLTKRRSSYASPVVLNERETNILCYG